MLTPLQRGFLVVVQVVIPREAEKPEQRLARALKVLNEILILHDMHVDIEFLPVGGPEFHDRGIEPGRLLKAQEIGHGVIEFESLHEAAQHAVAGVAQDKDEFRIRKDPVDEAGMGDVQGQLIDDEFAVMTSAKMQLQFYRSRRPAGREPLPSESALRVFDRVLPAARPYPSP